MQIVDLKPIGSNNTRFKEMMSQQIYNHSIAKTEEKSVATDGVDEYKLTAYSLG